MILVPAYGRDYKTAADVKKDWEANKDFKIASVGPYMGAYIGKKEFDKSVSEASYIRYDKLTKLTFIGQWEEDHDEE